MSYLTIALFVFFAFATGGATVFFFLRDRAQAGSGKGTPGPEPLTNEVRAIGTQIENALAEQRLQGETQRMVLSQKLDGVRQTVDTQQAQVQVLQSEMRHESQRRDAEIAEIHDRLASIQTGPALAPPPSLALEAHAPEPVEAYAAEPVEDASVEVEPVYDPSPTLEDETAFEDASTPPAIEEVAEISQEDRAAPLPADSFDSLFSDVTFEDVSFQAHEDEAPALSTTVDAGLGDLEIAAPAAETAPEQSAEATALEDESEPANAPLYEAAFETPVPKQLAPPTPSVFEDAAPFLPTPEGDGSAPDTVFDTWAPTTPAPQAHAPSPVLEAPSAPTASAPTVDLEVADTLIEPSTPPEGQAWIARPTGPDAEPVIANDLVFSMPEPEETAFEEPSFEDVADIEAGLEAMLGASPPLEDVAPEQTTAPAEEASEPFVAPEGADDLTVITSIDEDVQRLLYQAGVTTLDEIAQWGRTSARRYSSAVSVSEETIMTQWVFEAQAALFNRYATQVGQ